MAMFHASTQPSVTSSGSPVRRAEARPSSRFLRLATRVPTISRVYTSPCGGPLEPSSSRFTRTASRT